MLLELSNVTKRFAAVDGAEAPEILRGVDLSVEAGESLAIVGPSGSGKSTLLHIIGTLDEPTEGSVYLGDRDLTKLNADELARVRNEEMGFIFQMHHLLPQCTVLENVLVPTLVHAGGGSDAEARAKRLLERVGLAHRIGHRPGQLSGGEQQRVAVVRALINEPKLLLADEPTGSLDQKTADSLATLLGELNKEEGVTLIVVTHAMSLAERMGKVMRLEEGRLVEGAG